MNTVQSKIISKHASELVFLNLIMLCGATLAMCDRRTDMRGGVFSKNIWEGASDEMKI